jgi:hypothetical protein
MDTLLIRVHGHSFTDVNGQQLGTMKLSTEITGVENKDLHGLLAKLTLVEWCD